MKYAFLFSCLFIVLSSCKKEKELSPSTSNFIGKIKYQLKDSLSSDDMQQLDFSKAVQTNIPTKKQTFLRIPFKNKSFATDFILLIIESNNQFSSGKIFNIIKNRFSLSSNPETRFNGNINIYSLQRKLLTRSLITNGFVDAFHPKPITTNLRTEIAIVLIPLLPEVIIVCSPSGGGGGGGGWDNSYYYNLLGLSGSGDVSGITQDVNTGGGSTSIQGGGSGYYSNSDPNPSGTGNPPLNNDENNILTINNPMLVDFEPVENLSPINLDQYIKCFNSIPDDGAICSIRILADIPVDKDPTIFFDWKNGSPGHSFIQIVKTNGTQSVRQNIGFYPNTNWKNIMTTAPVDAKFVDNAEHEFNASLFMSLTPEQLKGVLIHMQYLERFIKYDIDDYNCTDFALEIFNYKRGGNQLTIPMYDIPGGTAPNGTTTPEGLYQQLKKMKDTGSAESQSISIPGVKGYVGASHGPCN